MVVQRKKVEPSFLHSSHNESRLKIKGLEF